MHIPRPRRAGSRSRATALGLAALVTGLVAPGLTPAVAAGAPNLTVAKAQVDRTSVAEGDTLHVTHTVKNAGTAKSTPTVTRFYLTTDAKKSLAARKASRTNARSAPTDLRLVGEQPVKALKPGRSASLGSVELTVPVGTAAGSYQLLACADDRGTVKETDEADNCAVADKKLTVSAAKGSDGLVLSTFEDTAPWPPNDDLSVQMIKIFCQMVTPAQRMTLAQAEKSAEDFLRRTAGADALKALDESGQADTPVDAQNVAGAAVVGGSPGLALAALLRAHDLEPKIGTHLVNAAAVATSVGLPNEAIAFLDAAQGLDFRRPAMGISQQAIAMVVRGQALVMTGRPGPAADLFLAAKAAEPMLSEADAGLATIEACKGNDKTAARYVRKSRQREQEKDTTKPDQDPVRPAPALDTSHGEVTPLRTLPMAETPAQGVVMRPVYDGIEKNFETEIEAMNDEQDRLSQSLDAGDGGRTLAEIQRRDSILDLVWNVTDEPAVTALQEAFWNKEKTITALRERFWGGGTGEVKPTILQLAEDALKACEAKNDGSDECYTSEMNKSCRPELSSAHSQWRGLMSELQTLGDAQMELVSQRMSAYASNLKDPDAHQLALLGIEQYEQTLYASLVQQANQWTNEEVTFQAECVDPSPAEVLTAPDREQAKSKGACPPEIAPASLVFGLGGTTVKVSCEKVSAEISESVLPLIGLFGEVSYEFRSGKLTMVAGAQVSAELGVVSGGFKSGMYLTSNNRGEISDVGIRVGPSSSVSAGPGEYQVYEDNVDLSFISAPKAAP